MNMPSDIKKALDAAHGAPVDLVDGDRRYVVISAEAYERLKEAAAADDWDPGQMRRTMAEVMQDDWTDPQMNSYDAQE